MLSHVKTLFCRFLRDSLFYCLLRLQSTIKYDSKEVIGIYNTEILLVKGKQWNTLKVPYVSSFSDLYFTLPSTVLQKTAVVLAHAF